MMKEKYIIVDIKTMDYMKNHAGVVIYDTEEKAIDACWINELKDAWVCKLVHNYKENRV